MVNENRVVALVGMAGSGKSEVAKILERQGFTRVRFGDITDQEIKKRGLALNEENERHIREILRKELGMAAYAILNRPRIDAALKSHPVVADGLYSWEEYLYFKNCYPENFVVIAVYASPQTRYERLSRREYRPLSPQEAAGRDKAEIENLNKGGPIAMADFTIINESTLDELKQQTEKILTHILN